MLEINDTSIVDVIYRVFYIFRGTHTYTLTLILTASNHVDSQTAEVIMTLILMQTCLCSCFRSKAFHAQNKNLGGFYWEAISEEKNTTVTDILSHSDTWNMLIYQLTAPFKISILK